MSESISTERAEHALRRSLLRRFLEAVRRPARPVDAAAWPKPRPEPAKDAVPAFREKLFEARRLEKAAWLKREEAFRAARAADEEWAAAMQRAKDIEAQALGKERACPP